MKEQTRENIIVTGSSGYVGRAVIKELSKKYFIIGLDREKKHQTASHEKHFDADFSSAESIREALENTKREFGDKIASVIHLATYYDFTGKPSPLYDSVTVQGTDHLLSALQAQQFEVGQFVFASTLLVYEPTVPGKPISEDAPLHPKWPYPESKVKTEKILFAKHGDVPLVILRMAGVYDDDGHSLPISRQIQRIYERWYLSHFFPGNRNHGQTFVHLDDLVAAFAKTVERRNKLPKELTLLIGEPKTYSFLDLQKETGCALYGQLWKTLRVPEVLAQAGSWILEKLPVRQDPLMNPTLIPFADDHFEINISRAEKTLGWKPRHSLKATIPKIIASLKRDPANWYKENKIDPPSWLKKDSVQPKDIRPRRKKDLSWNT